jgi:uncharacterized sporulation protein YeaH/YhbH (DUF444 family)
LGKRKIKKRRQQHNDVKRIMMSKESEQFTPEDIRYLKVAIALALGSYDILEMQKTKTTLNELYHKIERMEGGVEQ